MFFFQLFSVNFSNSAINYSRNGLEYRHIYLAMIGSLINSNNYYDSQY